jgi:hypothetical protein
MMVMRDLVRLFQFLAIPLAMTGFVPLASQAGDFVLRKDQGARVGSFLASPMKNTRG